MYKRNGVYWYRVRTPMGASRRVSLETRHEPTAKAVAAWADEVRERLDRQRVLHAVVAGELTLPQAFVLGEADAVAWLERQREVEADREVTPADMDAWGRWVMERGARTAADIYRGQVARLLPTPLYESMLAPRTITAALDGLDVAAPTRGRYRAAVASLCAFLHRAGRLDENPMDHVPGYGASTPRDVWYSTDDSLRLLHALPESQQGLEAVMWACGWEWAAITNARVEDFDLTAGTAFARGTKTAKRRRMTVITESAAVPFIAAALKGKLPKALVWGGCEVSTIRRRHQAAARQLGLEHTTLHDWRHTFAVRELRKGRSLTFVSQMLGHKNTTLVQTTYGQYALTTAELQDHAAQSRHIAV
jgi:integrase